MFLKRILVGESWRYKNPPRKCQCNAKQCEKGKCEKKPSANVLPMENLPTDVVPGDDGFDKNKAKVKDHGFAEVDGIPTPTEFGPAMTDKEVKSLLQKVPAFSSAQIVLLDSSYISFDLKYTKDFLAKTYIDTINYFSEKCDCDDHTLILLGDNRKWLRNALPNEHAGLLGFMYGDIRLNGNSPYHHMMNIFIDKDKKIWLVEPQTDKVRPVSDLHEGSRLTMILF